MADFDMHQSVLVWRGSNQGYGAEHFLEPLADLRLWRSLCAIGMAIEILTEQVNGNLLPQQLSYNTSDPGTDQCPYRWTKAGMNRMCNWREGRDISIFALFCL